MCWTIAGSALVAAAGLVPAAPASADVSAGAGANGGTIVDNAGAMADNKTSTVATRRTSRSVDGTPPRGPRRVLTPDPVSEVPGRSGRGPALTPRDDTKPGPRPEPCHRWPYWPPWPPLPESEVGNRNVFAGAGPPVPSTPPVTVLSWSPPAAVSVSPAGAASAAGVTATAPGAASLPSYAALDGGIPTRIAVQPLPKAPATLTPPPSGPAAPARAPLPPPAKLPPASMLPQATGVAEAVRQALPGLVGLAVLTVGGGLLGYRQAKAGFALRAAGTARYLR